MAIFTDIKDTFTETLAGYKQTAVDGYRNIARTLPGATPLMIARSYKSSFEQLKAQLIKNHDDIEVQNTVVNTIIRKLDAPLLTEIEYKSFCVAFTTQPLILARVFSQKRPSQEFAASHLFEFIKNADERVLKDSVNYVVYKKALLNLSKYPASFTPDEKKLENVAFEAFSKIKPYMNSDDVLEVYSSSLNYSVKNGILTDLNKLINKNSMEGKIIESSAGADYLKLLADLAIKELKGDATNPFIMRQFKPALKLIVAHKDADEKIIAKALSWSVDIETVWLDQHGNVAPKIDKKALAAKVENRRAEETPEIYKKAYSRYVKKTVRYNEKDLDKAAKILRGLSSEKKSAVLEFMRGLNAAMTEKLASMLSLPGLLARSSAKNKPDVMARFFLNSIDGKNADAGAQSAASFLMKTTKKERDRVLSKMETEEKNGEKRSRVEKAVEVKQIVSRLRKGAPWISSMESRDLVLEDIISDINNDPDISDKSSLMIKAIRDFRATHEIDDRLYDIAKGLTILLGRERSAQEIVDLANMYKPTGRKINKKTDLEIRSTNEVMGMLSDTNTDLLTIIENADNLKANLKKDAKETRKNIRADIAYRKKKTKFILQQGKKA